MLRGCVYVNVIFSVILCCVISVQIEARTIRPVYITGRDQGTNMKRIREQNDAYGEETVQLNGSSVRAPTWPKANSGKENMFLTPRILQTGDQINITGQISPNPNWITLSLITERYGTSGEPDYSNIVGQIYMQFNSNEETTAILKTISNGNEEKYVTDTPVLGLIPGDSQKVEIGVKLSGSTLEFFVGESYVDQIKVKHNYGDIRFIAFDGDIEKVKSLGFVFG